MVKYLIKINNIRILALLFLVYASGAYGAQSAVKKDKKNDRAPSNKPPALKLTEILQEAFENNPDLREAKHKALSARAKIGPSGAYPDPKVGFALSNFPIDTFSSNRTPMTGKELSFSQQIPFPGKMTQKKRAATHRYEAAKRQFEDHQFQLVHKVKRAFNELGLVHRKLEIAKENFISRRQFVGTASAKYSVGKGLQQDVLKAQVEQSGISKSIILLEREIKVRSAVLNRLLGRSAEGPLPPPEALVLTKVNFDQVTVDQILRLGDRDRPALKSAKSMVKSAESEVSFASWNFLPNFEVGFKYRFREPNLVDSGTDFASAYVGMTVPLYFFSKQIPERRAAAENFRAASSREVAIQLDTREKVYSFYNQAYENARLVELYKKKLVPQARQAFKSAGVGYQVNKVDFLTLLDNEKALFAHRTAYEVVRVQYENAIAALEAYSGHLAIDWIRGSSESKQIKERAGGKKDE